MKLSSLFGALYHFSVVRSSESRLVRQHRKIMTSKAPSIARRAIQSLNNNDQPTEPSKPAAYTGLNFTCGEEAIVPKDPELFYFIPDGPITSIPVQDENNNNTTKNFVTFWPHAPAYRTIGPTPTSLLENDGNHHVQFSSGFDPKSEYWCSGGLWLMGVIPLAPDNWVGIWHAEDHYEPDFQTYTAWKSIAVSKSLDRGRTWSKPQQIISAYKPKPDTPHWGGAGDCNAVWDKTNGRIVILYCEDSRITAAMSTDLEGLTNWKKWDGEGFTNSDGLGGEVFALPNIDSQPGANPSVQWNDYLKRWIMAWHSWGGDIYMSASDDLVNWEEPQLAVEKPPSGEKVWYPTLMDPSSGSATGSREIQLYYAWMRNDRMREMMVRNITFED